MTFIQHDPRRERGRAVPPDPATIFTPAELARLKHVRSVRALGQHWLLDYPEIKRGLFTKALIAAGRIGRGDIGSRTPDDFDRWLRSRKP